MRSPARKDGRGRKAIIKSIQAPIKGWNTLDSIALMDDDYAVILDNFIPTPSSVSLRPGSITHKTLTGRVETLAAYNAGTTSKLFAAVTSNIYDVTTAGAVGAAVVSGKANARWQHVNFATAGGSYLVMVNGDDDLLLYDGTTWANINTASTPAITGIDSNKFNNVCVFQNRLWFVEENSLSVWYLPTASIAGAAAELNMSSLFPRGGYLVAMGDWTIDSGSGVDDYAVFITSEGEVAVYRGTDPSDVATWQLVGIYQVGQPIGKRCMMKFASDLLIINKDGLQLMSAALSNARIYSPSVTDKIQPTLSQSISTYGTNYGWEAVFYADQDAIVLNVPITGGSQQYAMNTLTKGWWRCTGWDAACFEVMGDYLYFGTTNAVKKAFIGKNDDGISIKAEALQAFGDMGNKNMKQWVMAQPVILTDSNSVGILAAINVDYDTSAPTGSPSFTSGTNATWGTSLWGQGVWGGNLSIKKDWQTMGAIGLAGAIYIKSNSDNSNILWASTNYIYNVGSSYF